jgi:hypothetical protein
LRSIARGGITRTPILVVVATLLAAVVSTPVGAASVTPWVAVIGGAGLDTARDVALDGAGNAYVVGQFEQLLTLGPDPADTLAAHGEDDVYLAKYDASGAFRWARQIGSGLDDRAGGVVVLPSGRVTVAGTGWKDTIVGALGAGGVKLPPYGATDVFLATFTATGDLVWASSHGGPGWDDAAAITRDEWGRVAITGSFTQSAGFGTSIVLPDGSVQAGTNPVTLTAKALQDAYVASFDGSGQLRWAHDVAAGGSQDLGRTILAIGGRLVVVGIFEGTTKIGTTQVYASDLNSGAAYLTSLSNADGSVVWIRLLRGASTNNGAPIDLAATPNGDVVAVGSLRGAVDFVEPGQPKQATITAGSSTANLSSFVLRFGQGGTYRWAAAGTSVPDGTSVDAGGVAVDAAGEITVVGRFGGLMTWSNAPERGPDASSASSDGGPDGFIVHYSPWGTIEGIETITGNGSQSVAAIAGDVAGGARIVGYFAINATFPGGTTRTSTTLEGFVASLAPA